MDFHLFFTEHGLSTFGWKIKNNNLSLPLMEILFVDDNELIQVRLSRSLKKLYENMTVYIAADYKEAIRLFSKVNSDLVILDISLPDGSGVDLLRIMKKEKPLLPIFMFTSFGTGEFKKSCLELGADGFFDKTNIHGLMDTIGLQYNISNKI